MKIKDLFKRSADNAQPLPQIKPVFVRTYKNMHGFRGTKKIHVTIYGDKYGANENALSILGDADEFGCVDSEITLTGFNFNGSKGIRVAVDDKYIGVAWDKDDDVYKATYKGDIAGVYVLLEKKLIFEQKRGKFVPDRYDAKASLFVKLK